MKSLGPKPTKAQMETLKKLAEPGVKVHWWSGIGSGPDSANIQWPNLETQMRKREVLRTDTMHKFVTWGWLVAIGDPGWAWRNMEYQITENGVKVMEKGDVRK